MDIITYALGKKGMQQSVSDYLDEHLTNPTNPPLDTSLEIAGAAADSKATGDKLSALKEDLTHLIEGSLVNVLPKNLVIIGSYTENDVASNPTGGGSTSRMASGIAFDLDILNNSNFVFNSDGAYNIAFVGFNDNDVCVSTPLSWMSDGTFTKSDVLTNSRGGLYSATKFGFQFKKINGTGGIVPFLIDKYCTVNKYLSLPTNSIKDDAVTEQKLSVEVRDKINGINKTVDVIMFMGQSNMAGRGNSAQAPALINGAGYEYRAISAPNTLSPMVEPFGATESNPQGIDEGSAKTGSMVVAFTNAYYTHNGKVPVVGISASKGGTTIADWQPDAAYLNDAISRLSSCVNYLTTNGYTIRHKFILWCQGESDGDNNTTSEDYKTAFDAMLAEMISEGIEKLFLVRIGNLNSGTSTKYETIMDCQTDIAQTEPNVVMASTDFAGMRSRGMMPDQFHYTQAAYNEVGTYSGVNVAMFVVSGKEPTMYDTQDGTLYYSHKN